MYVYNISRLVTHGWNFRTRDRSFGLRSRHYRQHPAAVVMSTSLQSASRLCWRSCGHGVFVTSVQFVFPWSTTTVIARTSHRSAWSLWSVVHLPMYGLYSRALRSGDDLQRNQWVRKEAFLYKSSPKSEARAWSPHSSTFVLVTECDVLSIYIYIYIYIYKKSII
jgi:hypothetical protein